MLQKATAERPIIPTNLGSIEADPAKALTSDFKRWFSAHDDKLVDCAKQTKAYLIKYDRTPSPLGARGEEMPWVRIEDELIPDLEATTDEDRIDLRLSGLRIKTFAEGTCRLIGLLDEIDILPKNANSYNDRSTNLIEFAIHERLMRSYIKCQAAGGNHEEIASFKLGDLVGVYLYGAGVDQAVIRAKVVQMASVGLWEADKPKKSRIWRIRARPTAIKFHKEVFGPVVKHFRPYLSGGFKGYDVSQPMKRSK
ncbi:hypothetical protein GFM44_23215 [Rhizobium leguminosarum bv. viciae]|nr:hypothetical protein [Rhizobium leguminosarum bv. viciae]